ncbi:uncharacterized protein MYCGRDRAFT_106647 [Zymoseptoria tritici IPO323]|uniref:Uncharacterized protein n=1 Tax=Zymoseptoria tritici (strain CBS 115943 / IPO323) TaxID=336722 RepID=F9XRI0_ZYMTI|nr:uncharacterized protein MYCGRDRAFT_106647 [Zymoseptoria tritici IPO323]EGP82138.1 hypothetical protein MYCGRDRAFT_106647 [Zymoseptoria tritici IPO323]
MNLRDASTRSFNHVQAFAWSACPRHLRSLPLRSALRSRTTLGRYQDFVKCVFDKLQRRYDCPRTVPASHPACKD